MSDNQEPSPISLDKIINISSLKENDLVIFRVNDIVEELGPVIEAFATRYGEELKKKNITVVILNKNQELEVLSERDLNKMGLFRKGKIIC